MEKIANLMGVSTSFWSPYFCYCPFCSRQCCKTSICISCCRSRLLTCTNPMRLSAFTSSPSSSCTGEQSFQLLLNRWLLVFIHQSFCHVCQIYKQLHNFFWGILTILDSIYKRDALATSCLYCLNKLTAWQVCVLCLYQKLLQPNMWLLVSHTKPTNTLYWN